jgi:hypothetical protein
MAYPAAERIRDLFREDALNLTSEFRLARHRSQADPTDISALRQLRDIGDSPTGVASLVGFPQLARSDPGPSPEADTAAPSPPAAMRPAITEDGDAAKGATALSPTDGMSR